MKTKGEIWEKKHVGEMNLSPTLFWWRLIRRKYQIAGFIGFPWQFSECKKKLTIDGVIKNLRGADLKKKNPLSWILAIYASFQLRKY